VLCPCPRWSRLIRACDILPIHALQMRSTSIWRNSSQRACQSPPHHSDSPAGNDCTIKPSVVRGRGSLREHQFNAPQSRVKTRIIALVDNGCGSDCEYMTQVIAGLPGTVIAGTSTYGVMGFTQPGYFVLPHCRVPFRLALSRTDEYGDGRSVDGYGITVDILLPDAASQTRASLLGLARRLTPLRPSTKRVSDKSV